MRYKGQHERSYNLPKYLWAICSWLLAIVFLSMSYFYATQGHELSFLIWFCLGGIWLYIAIKETTKWVKQR